MANIFYPTTGSFSALTPKNMVGLKGCQTSYGAYDALNTERTDEFTPSAAQTVTGFYLCLKVANTAAQSITAKLQKYSGAAWGDVAGATCTINYDDVIGTHKANYDSDGTNGDTGYCWKYFELTTPALVTTDASTWRVSVKSTDAKASWWRSSPGWAYGVVTSTDTVYTATDNICIKENAIITVDQSITVTSWICGVNSEVVWANPPAASYTFTCTNFYFSCDSAFRYGSSTNRIAYAVRGTIAITNWISVLAWNHNDMPHELEIYGAVPTLVKTAVASTASLGQKVIVVTDTVAGTWVGGDSITILGATGYETRTIDTVVGSTVTVTVNLTYTHTANWFVINETRAEQMGCIVSVAMNPNHSDRPSYFTKFAVSGVKLTAAFTYYIGYYSVTVNISTTNRANIVPFYISDIYVPASSNIAVTLTTGGSILDASNNGATFSRIYNLNTAALSQRILYNSSTWATISDLCVVNYVGGIPITTANSTISNVQFSTASWGKYAGGYSYNSVYLTVNACTISGIKANNCQAMISGNSNTISGVTVDNTIGLSLGTGVQNTFTDCSFGQVVGNTYSLDMGVVFIQNTFYNCLFDTVPVNTTSVAAMIPGSYIKTHTYHQVANDHRVFWVRGNTRSTGDGLTDTTVHTAGTGKFAIRMEPTSSITNLEWEFDVPTGNISAKTMTVAVWCKINNAAYYAGTNQLPRLTIDYDNGTTAYCQAAQSTSWQQLFVTFTPTTTYGQITVTLSGRTDATTTNAYIYWDDLALLYPANNALDLGGMDNWASALPVTPPIAIPVSAYTISAAVWEELIASHTTAGTLGKKLGKQLWNSTKMLGAG